MKASEAFDYVLNHYEIKAKEISDKTGKSEADISKFRNGRRNISANSLQELIAALPLKPRTHFCMLWLTMEDDKTLERETA